jgi:two-component system sensor histidine kinase CiaH
VQICTEAERNTRLLDSMLTLARIDSRQQEPQFVWLSLQDSVKQAVQSCRSLANNKDVKLLFEQESSSARVWADPNHLNRLWLLLLDNAIKYTPSNGQVTVQLTWNATAEPVCEISDSGIGIQPSDLAGIFQRFYRAENARLT